jgi:hypothetical protein
MFLVLDAHAPPNVIQFRRKAEFRLKQIPQAFGPFGQDLVGVPIRLGHDLGDQNDVFVGDVLVEQVAHRVDEHHLRLGPKERFGQFLGNQTQVEALLVGMARHAPKAFGERLGVAVGATGLILVQPRTGFQVASVHSILVFVLKSVISSIYSALRKMQKAGERFGIAIW